VPTTGARDQVKEGREGRRKGKRIGHTRKGKEQKEGVVQCRIYKLRWMKLQTNCDLWKMNSRFKYIYLKY
jgi:hypothetical protein